jgi:hypothetical protein
MVTEQPATRKDLILPRWRFDWLKRTLRRCTPNLYGWMLANQTLKSAFHKIRGGRRIPLGNTVSDVFTTIYETNYWLDPDSVSGAGSNLYATEKIRGAIPALFQKYGIRSVLDVPCGDFYWFHAMQLKLDRYVGGDIVRQLIEQTSEKYGSDTHSFRVMDLTGDALPQADLILVRDCFIHLPLKLVFASLRNIAASDISYLLTTHWPEQSNIDIPAGRARPINLCAAPFHFPPPTEQIEDFDKGNPVHYLALWHVDSLRAALRNLEHASVRKR